VRSLLRSLEIIVYTWRAARQSMDGIDKAEVREALKRLDPLWDELFPAEQARIVQLLVERVDVGPDSADKRLRTNGLTTLVADGRQPTGNAGCPDAAISNGMESSTRYVQPPS
jgi:site-specific DNA recombinase